MAGPGGQPGSRRISRATLAAQASAALAVAPPGKAVVRVSRRVHCPSTRTQSTAAPAATP
eukprot:11180845-Lingulodinium_polyedra.AAC.1